MNLFPKIRSFLSLPLSLLIGRMLILGTFFSCTLIQKFAPKSPPESMKMENYSYYSQQDYIDHLAALSESYLNSPGIKLIKISEDSKAYLQSIFNKIIKNNELLIESDHPPSFIIIDHEIPFYFSLPNGRIFLSLGLIRKYIRHEGDLVSIITFEIIKSYRNLYNANIIVPIGFISTERLISLTRIPLPQKIKIYKWEFYALKRSGFDPYYILSWIQGQNRNSLDFYLHLGDIKNIAKEEYLLKSFILDKKFNNKVSRIKKNSSKSFYKFIHEFKKGDYDPKKAG